MNEQPYPSYPNPERQIAPGDTVTHVNDPTTGGIVAGMNDKVIYVAWVKWNVALLRCPAR